jgi:hypothetical protein
MNIRFDCSANFIQSTFIVWRHRHHNLAKDPLFVRMVQNILVKELKLLIGKSLTFQGYSYVIIDRNDEIRLLQETGSVRH